MNRSDADALVCESTQGDSLRKHMLAVEATIREQPICIRNPQTMIELLAYAPLRRTIGLTCAVLAMVAACPPLAADDTELLYNGIQLSHPWPPASAHYSREPQAVPYLAKPPEVIPIDVGRQLFVDDFLIAQTTLKRTFHHAEYHPANPILTADRRWEKDPSFFAAPFSDGVWYDPRGQRFMMWYWSSPQGATSLALSRDGIHWEKPSFDVVPNTNVVLPVPDKLKGLFRDSSTVWIDHAEKDPQRRFKMFVVGQPDGFRLRLRTSPDGIHWSEPVAEAAARHGDRTSVFFNPFRNQWVVSLRTKGSGNIGRARAYLEDPDPLSAVRRTPGAATPWLSADRLDPHHPDPRWRAIEPQLYNFDTVAYESVMLGLYSIWQGPDNNVSKKLGNQKRCDVLVGFSRDGYHWSRPDRERFLGCNEVDGAWNWGNVQSSGGGCLVVRDKLYFYVSGRALDPSGNQCRVSTGLATLRRDGFASLDAADAEGTVTTRPVRFGGKRLFVNVVCPQGELRAEVLDQDGNALAPFTRSNCVPVKADATFAPVTWKGAEDLSALTGKPVRFRFYLRQGQLYSFWVSPDATGASSGWVAAGGPGYDSPRDTVGHVAYRAASEVRHNAGTDKDRSHNDKSQAPRTVTELWADYDPRAEPLNVEVLQEWTDKGIVFRYLRYTVGTFRGRAACMAALYAVPQGARKVPGLVQVHGGGQMAHLNAVKTNAARGYACISINWLGNPVSGIRPGLPNTDWGTVDATQRGHNSGFTSLQPDAKTIDSVISPRNSNWYLGVMAARRALTLLEQQPEVDGQRLGVYGHSMGGTVTVRVAAVDPRVRAAAPTCGGFGAPPSYRPDALTLKTIADEAHLPLVTCPILLGSPTNDFNGVMDDADQVFDTVRSKDIRCTRPVHFDHRTTANEAICIPLWFDEYLKGTFRFPKTPRAVLDLKQADGVPLFTVTPDKSRKIGAVDLFYSRGDDPRTRYWISVPAQEADGTWTAKCPLLDANSTLRVFANVTYALDEPVTTAEYYYSTVSSDKFSISSRIITITPESLQAAHVKATDEPTLLIDDFARGWQDWWGPDPEGMEHWTRKINDPKWRGPDDGSLELSLKSRQDNTLVVVLKTSPWAPVAGSDRGKQYFATAKLSGSADWQTIRLARTDFHRTDDGQPLATWSAIDELGLVPSIRYKTNGRSQTVGGPWRGPSPTFKSISWAPGNGK